MYSFIKDIAFMEQLKNNGFDYTHCLTMVNDKNFYSGKKQMESIHINISNKGRVTGLFVCGVIKMTDNNFYHLVNLSH